MQFEELGKKYKLEIDELIEWGKNVDVISEKPFRRIDEALDSFVKGFNSPILTKKSVKNVITLGLLNNTLSFVLKLTTEFYDNEDNIIRIVARENDRYIKDWDISYYDSEADEWFVIMYEKATDGDENRVYVNFDQNIETRLVQILDEFIKSVIILYKEYFEPNVFS